MHLVWFKRDLRIHDHRPMLEAGRSGSVIGFYCFEPSLTSPPDYSDRHRAFILECIRELRDDLHALDIYNPVKQAMNHDPKGIFVRRWIPALRKVPDRWLFEPWKMPPLLQERFGAIVERDFPAPIVDLPQSARLATICTACKGTFCSLARQARHEGDVAVGIESPRQPKIQQ
jgi:deoxyribodipyrimidine photolyase